jgi:hypothetical protein
MTTRDKAGAGGGRKRGLGRLRFLSRIGAGGLAAAAVVFARPTPAMAYDYGCCTLCKPPSGTYSQCASGRYYFWRCSRPSIVCECCEHGTTSGSTCTGVQWSWGLCRYYGPEAPAA